MSRTTGINSAFGHSVGLKQKPAKNKMGESTWIFDIPHSVVPMGTLSKFEPEDLIRIFEFLEIVEPSVELYMSLIRI